MRLNPLLPFYAGSGVPRRLRATRTASSTASTAGLLVLGVMVGAGLIFGTTYLVGGFSAKTTTITAFSTTVTVVSTTTITATVTSTVTPTQGTLASPATLSNLTSSVACSASTQTCTMSVANSGTTDGEITGAGPGPGSGAAVTASGARILVPAGSPGTSVTVTLSGTVAKGETVSGYLTQGNGPNLYFTAVLQ